MPLRTENGIVYGEFIKFLDLGPTESGKTRRFAVYNSENNSFLGIIKWHGAWRKYIFEPSEAIFEWVCLRDISEFIETRTKEHKGVK